MNKVSLISMAYGAAMVGLVLMPTAAGGELKYKTARELRDACKNIVGPFKPQFRRQPDPDDKRAFVVDYLGAENPGLQKEAADILAQLMYFGRRIRSNAFEQYLAPKYPLHVRMVALAYSMDNYRYVTSTRVDDTTAEKWNQVLNSAIDCPISPPYLFAVALRMARNSRFMKDWFGQLAAGKRDLVIRRLLALLPGVTDRGGVEGRAQEIAIVLYMFPPEALVKAVPVWYEAEPSADARWAFMRLICLRAGGGGPAKVPLKPLLEMAARDVDERISNKAKRVLQDFEH